MLKKTVYTSCATKLNLFCDKGTGGEVGGGIDNQVCG